MDEVLGSGVQDDGTPEEGGVGVASGWAGGSGATVGGGRTVVGGVAGTGVATARETAAELSVPVTGECRGSQSGRGAEGPGGGGRGGAQELGKRGGGRSVRTESGGGG